MSSNLILAFIYIVWAMLSYSLWRKNKDGDLLWFIWFGAIGFFAESADFVLKHFFQPPSSVLLISASARLVFTIMAVSILILIGFRMLIKSQSK